ncbi:LuxR C-terminal-related transcriptional regulator [Mycolicibacterium septicum]|uniref:LuxR C-terminal-related transcriptional regulator n=1 Tax=Mycolicibacterium septicum TaxID=98668 RepID=UPI00235FB8C9|nr:LuxR C-terminal-related transcriptional regulator [Mycolicibacterium septicum]
MFTTETDTAHIERARNIVSAAARLLDSEPCPPPADGDLATGDAALSATRSALVAAKGHVPGARLTSLVTESVAAQSELKDALLEQRVQLAGGVRDALAALRNATSSVALAQRAPVEARRIGFRRALFSGIENGTWVSRTAFAVDDADFAEELVEVGRANPRTLNGPLLESEMVRRCTPVMVADAQSNPRVHAELVRYADTTSYVAAPVLAWGVPVAMVHADRDKDRVDEFDRYMLGVYAEGLGLAIERTQLMERMQAVRKASSDYLTNVTAIADEFSLGGLGGPGPVSLGLDGVPERGLAPAGLHIEEHGERLTPREWDVLRNLASGKTNAQIATGLFVTEGTVKSHVKHILRKLGATNRTEAVARYHRLSSAAQDSKVAG